MVTSRDEGVSIWGLMFCGNCLGLNLVLCWHLNYSAEFPVQGLTKHLLNVVGCSASVYMCLVTVPHSLWGGFSVWEVLNYIVDPVGLSFASWGLLSQAKSLEIWNSYGVSHHEKVLLA